MSVPTQRVGGTEVSRDVSGSMTIDRLPAPDAGAEPRGEQESARLAAVDRYAILDTPPDGAFDRVTAMAARALDAPVAIISIVDSDRIWFKSHHGLDVDQIDRSPGLCASAILQGEPWLVEDAQRDPRTLANPLVAGALGLGFYLGVPLRTTDGHNLGTLCVIDYESRSVTDREMADLVDLAAMVMDKLELRLAARRAVAIEEQLRGEAEQLARDLQESLLPARLPEHPGLEVAARYRPAHRERVGGDFYDVFTNGSSLGLVIGDVCGHGPAAAALTSRVRHTVRALARGDWRSADCLDRLNRIVLESDRHDERFCTVGLLRLDPGPGGGFSATAARAGHPPAFLVHDDGSIERVGGSGLPVGLLGGAAYEDAPFDLRPGDTLFLYTDGLTDAGCGGRAFDEDRLRCVLAEHAGRPPQRVADAVIETVDRLDDDPRDDIALLVARVTPPAAA